MKFSTFLNENQMIGLDLITKLNTLSHLVSDRLQKRFQKLQVQSQFFSQQTSIKSLYNVDYEETKEMSSRFFDDLYQSIAYSTDWYKYDSDQTKILDTRNIEVNTHAESMSLKKNIRNLVAAQKLNLSSETKRIFHDMLQITEVFLYYVEAFKAVKPEVIKGRKKAEPDPNKFQNHIGSSTSIALVKTYLLKSITQPLNDLEEQFTKYFKGRLEALDQSINSSKTLNDLDPMKQIMLQMTYSYKIRGYGKTKEFYDFKRNDDADLIPHKEAHRQRNDIESQFLHKNIHKLSNLLDKKNNLLSVEVMPSSPVKLHNGSGTLTSEMIFKFNDSARFTVRNKVMINYSAYGKMFYQFPTTFHDVIMHNGTKLESPSEEKMVNHFVTPKS